jgi:hypothetical protein
METSSGTEGTRQLRVRDLGREGFLYICLESSLSVTSLTIAVCGAPRSSMSMQPVEGGYQSRLGAILDLYPLDVLI